MDKDMKKNVERLGQASRLIEEEQMHGDNIAGIIEINERTEDTNELITKLTKKLKVWKEVLITGIVVFILILLYMLFSGVVHKEPTPVAPDYKESDPNISTEVTKEEPRDETIYWYYKNNIPAIDVSQIETTTVHSIYNQGYDVQYLGYMTDRYWGDMLYPDDSTHPLNIDAVPDDKVYLMDSLVEQYNSTQRIYEKFDGEISYPQVTEAQDYNFCCALAINDKDTLVAADSILFEFYNEASLQGIESIQAYGDSGLVITVYGDVSDSEIQSGVETVINSYTNEETFYLGDTDVFDKTVEQFSYLGDKVKISYTSKDKKSTDNEAPADTKVTKTYIIRIYDVFEGTFKYVICFSKYKRNEPKLQGYLLDLVLMEQGNVI